MEKSNQTYAKTSMGFYIRRCESSIALNRAYYSKYQAKQISFDRFLELFRQNNDLTEEELSADTFKDWCRWIGWKIYD